jgi:hypothetical protein
MCFYKLYTVLTEIAISVLMFTSGRLCRVVFAKETTFLRMQNLLDSADITFAK